MCTALGANYNRDNFKPWFLHKNTAEKFSMLAVLAISKLRIAYVIRRNIQEVYSGGVYSCFLKERRNNAHLLGYMPPRRHSRRGGIYPKRRPKYVTHQKIYLKKDAVPSLSFGGNEESDSEKENQQATYHSSYSAKQLMINKEMASNSGCKTMHFLWPPMTSILPSLTAFDSGLKQRLQQVTSV
ncbi:hypothetical protein NQ317_008714 [Molorchus minor]|uniref:Ribosomal protein L15 n=1 Tax=Molorchus minor TaxID=1323400 RepID=A0ABQ9JGZ8_9CUCU|nr:hypothetical protein NQ317_008714 [Molorchus minor]